MENIIKQIKSVKLIDYIEVLFLSLIVLLPSIVTLLKRLLGIAGLILPLAILYVLFIVLIIKTSLNKHYIIPQNFICFFILLIYVLVYFFLNSYYEIYHIEKYGIFDKIINGYSSIFTLLFFSLTFCEMNYKRFLFLSSIVMLLSSLVSLAANGLGPNGYDMNFGYKITYSSLCFVLLFFEFSNKYLKIAFGVLFLSTIALIFAFGSRAPVFCIIFFIIIYYNLFLKQKLKHKTRTVIFCIVLSLAPLYVASCLIASLTGIADFLPRNVQTLFNPLLLLYSNSSASRIRIYNDIFVLLKDSPFFGFGPLSDQFFLGNGVFSHNILLEFFMTFGIPLGGVIFSFLLILIIKTFCCYKNTRIKYLFLSFLIFFSLSFVRLLVSNSFWYDAGFWLFVSTGIQIVLKNTRIDLLNKLSYKEISI